MRKRGGYLVGVYVRRLSGLEDMVFSYKLAANVVRSGIQELINEGPSIPEKKMSGGI